MPQPVREGPDTVRMNGGFIDVDRSLALWRSYRGARQVVAEGRWPDKASVLIPFFYAGTGYELAQALAARGRHAEATEVMGLTMQVATTLEDATR